MGGCGMKLSVTPDLGSRAKVLIAAASVCALVVAILLSRGTGRLDLSLGDTDDALRLVMMRDLAAGQGWFDPLVARLQPPHGVHMHWSRLIDGGLAGLYRVFAILLPAPSAETATRALWPMLWMGPAVLGALLAARRLGGGAAVFILGVWLVASANLFHQFVPGRIDHHNAQIAFCLLAFGASMRGWPGRGPSPAAAATAGAATALGLAIGLEGLAFHVVIGAAIGLGWALRKVGARSLIAYGAALGLGALVLYAVQTPPSRWTLAACDALAINLVAALALSGVALVAAAAAGARRTAAERLGMLTLAAAAALAVYVALDPSCLRGPLGLDADLTAAWLDNVQEMSPWPLLLRSAPADALRYAFAAALGAASWLWLGRRRDQRADPAWMLAGALLFLAMVLMVRAARAEAYLQWFAAPLIAAALVDMGRAAWKDRMLPAIAVTAGLAIAPAALLGVLAKPKPVSAVARGADAACTATRSFAFLASLPPGVVLGEIDAGPYILAHTPHAAVAAPYHRMAGSLRGALTAFAAEGPQAERQVQALGADYVVACPAHAFQSDRLGLKPDSLMQRLDQGRAPAWLERLSPDGAALQVYRVRASTRR